MKHTQYFRGVQLPQSVMDTFESLQGCEPHELDAFMVWVKKKLKK